jgi:hypothetical protein
MADIIVRQANSTSLTVQSSSNQVLVRQQPNNTVVVQTTGNSYVLPVATNSTLGGIIVGDNLTINANGLLSAQAGGVSTFNNRTGNVTLTANDVSAVGNSLYFPLNANIVSGNATIAGQIDYTLGNWTGLPPATRQIYGISKTNTLFGTEYQAAIGINYQYAQQGLVLMSRAYTPDTNRGLSQTEIRCDAVSSALTSTNRNSNGTLSSIGTLSASYGGVGLYYEQATPLPFNDGTTLTYIESGPLGVFFWGVARGVNNESPGYSELLTRGAADTLYEKLVRKN